MTNLSTQQQISKYSFDQSEADTIIFSAGLRQSRYSCLVSVDTADTDACIATVVDSQRSAAAAL